MLWARNVLVDWLSQQLYVLWRPIHRHRRENSFLQNRRRKLRSTNCSNPHRCPQSQSILDNLRWSNADWWCWNGNSEVLCPCWSSWCTWSSLQSQHLLLSAQCCSLHLSSGLGLYVHASQPSKHQLQLDLQGQFLFHDILQLTRYLDWFLQSAWISWSPAAVQDHWELSS